jgi:hypothetical protein
MSREARDWAWRQAVTPTQKLVLLALAERADVAGACWPSLSALERVTGLSRRGLTKTLAGLDGALLERIAGGANRSTRYRLRLTVEASTEVEEHAQAATVPKPTASLPDETGREPHFLGNDVPGEPGSLGNEVHRGRELGALGREPDSPRVGNQVPLTVRLTVKNRQ